ncbi:hypothetical protein IWX76_002681 [Pedobacter sp. CAN_A7]|uniref:GAF domain-containing protein n=1 Tax=Pedobacter sp. CAN_A7 TaxID=2787722 RepID=UPI0018CB5FAB
MQAITLDLNKSNDGRACDIGIAIQFSFRPFIDHIVKKLEVERTAKAVFYQYILNKFKAAPELWEPMDTSQLKYYPHIFELIHSALSPLLNEEKNQLWAISMPVTPCFFSGTDAFYKILFDQQSHQPSSNIEKPSLPQMTKGILTSFYNLVLQRFYNFSFTVSDGTVRSIVDSQTRLLKYYRLNVDSRFINISYDGELPALNLENITDKIWSETSNLQILQNLLPLQNFKVEGFSIVDVVDVTAEYALENIKNVIIKHNKSHTGAHRENISIALKTLVSCEGIQFGLLPNLQVNGKVVVNNQSDFESVLSRLSREDPAMHALYQQRVDEYLKNPMRYIFPRITEEQCASSIWLKMLCEQGIICYAIFPLYFNGKIVGALEVHAQNADVFQSYILSKLETAFPLLSQLLQNLITDFNHELTTVVTEKFTSLQPAIRWRFYEAAFQYIYSGAKANNLPVEKIYFEKVNPFYGAIDIKDSSIKRNQAIRADLYSNFEMLESLFHSINLNLNEHVDHQFIASLSVCEKSQFNNLSDREVLITQDYLQQQLPAYLRQMANEHPELQTAVQQYLDAAHPQGGLFENSARYERSLQRINQEVTSHLEEFNAGVQEIFPCYFEKFRTDGVEYDLYMGQSIAPEITLPAGLLHTLRYKQLELMTMIVKATSALQNELEVYMQTTQLIFVYEKLIDISFRTDEQRFDVEGSYNIRYQMVKKRIDKAHVKDTQERLTQPGKITIIYFNSWEATEYKGYIEKLKQQNLLKDDLEFLEVEELQGVQGLKALRVGVVV